MDMTGEYRIPAPRQMVWEGLNSPDILKAAIPGCESIEKLSDTELQARVAAKVGPVSAKFSGKVTLSDIDPPNGYRISGEGTGGAAGFAKGGATVTLADDGAGGTVLSYKVDAQVGGKLAQIGSRLIDGVSRKMADDFFHRFSDAVVSAEPAPAETLAQPAEPVPSAPAPEPPPTAPTPEPPPTKTIEPTPMAPPVPSTPRGRVPAWAWILVLVVIVAIILWIFVA
ncbi:MAG: SRPBCC family protein [Stellaceae bacterium]